MNIYGILYGIYICGIIGARITNMTNIARLKLIFGYN